MTQDPPFTAEVAAYLADCAAHRGVLDPTYHPTESGALKVICHRHPGDPGAEQAAEDQIRAAYRTASRHRKEPPVNATPQPQRAPGRPVEAVPLVDDYAPAEAVPDGALLNAALDCARRGWHVMPVRPRAKKPPAFPDHAAAECTGRDPWCRGGHSGWEPRATTDPARIRRGWAAADWNVGIATGPSGLIVLDLDQPKPGDTPPPRWALPGINDGADVLAMLCEEHDEPMPWETLMVRTGRGGLHLYFTAPPGANLRNSAGERGGLGWLIDTRACGGYVIAPRSTVDQVDGTTGRYELLYDRPPAPLPAWLAALLTAARPQSSPLECRPSADGQVRNLDRYAATALKREAERVAVAVEGGRNAALNKAAYNLGQLIAAGTLPDDGTAERELHAAASAHFGLGSPPFTEADALATIRSAIAAAKRRPRRTAA